jgi:O-antigen/teichoic acid export membrane protein
VLGHTAAYLVIRAVNGVVAFASLFLLTRLLPADQYGAYALGITAINVLASVMFQWLNVAVARFHSTHATDTSVLLIETRWLFIRVAGALLAVGAGCSLTGALPNVPPTMVLVISVGAVVMGLHNLNLQFVNARGEPLRYGVLTASRAVFTLVAAVALVYVGFGGLGAVAGMAIGGLISAFFFGIRNSEHRADRNPELRRNLVAYGVPLSLTYVFVLVVDASDRFMIGLWHGTSAVASYAAAFDLAQQTIGAILNVFFLAGYPRVTVAWEAGGANAARVALAPLSRGMLLAAPAIVGMFVGMAPEIAHVMFGSALRDQAASLIPWIALAVGMSCVRGFLLDIALHLTKAARTHVLITATMATLNVALNLLLIPRLGAVGAAISAAAAFSMGTCLSWWFGRSTDVFPEFVGEALKAAAALASMVIWLRLCAPEIAGAELGDIAGALTKLGSGALLFAIVALATDLSGTRGWVARKLAAVGGRAR